MDAEIKVEAFVNTYEFLNTEVENLESKIFEIGRLIIYTDIFLKGFKVDKEYKTTKKGLKIKCIAIKSIEDNQQCIEKINELIDVFNENYGENLKKIK